MLASIIGANNTLTVFAGVRQYTAAKDHPNYKRIVAALAQPATPARERLIIKLLDVPYVLNKFTKGKAELRGGEVYFNGVVLHNELTRRILEVMNAGLPFAPMLRFLENVEMNPSARSKAELFKFLEHRALPITDDGYFLGYKKVRDNYFDWHSGNFDNSVGKVHQMPRENVDPDSAKHCSTGFHVGTIEYADKQFWSGQGRLVVVKVHPADAVSVPNDHSCQKIRVCKYEVVADYTSDLEGAVYGAKADTYVPNESDDAGWEDEVDVLDDVDDAPVTPVVKPKATKQANFHNKRGPDGRFAPRSNVRR